MNFMSSNWPDNRPFALFLSHDIDQIHDRELFRILADINHIRRIWIQGEKGSAPLAMRRLVRSLFFPKPVGNDFKTILELESCYGFHSSFYVLHDPYWSRNGPRYTLNSKALHKIVQLILDTGGELGLHGGYYRFNQAALYRESCDALRLAFGIRAVGVRNHFLRFSYPDTWLAHEDAGLQYDATFGYNDVLGPRDGRILPFFPVDPQTGRQMNILVLPLTVMDVTLFRNLGLNGKDALSAAWGAIEPVIQAGGLVSLLWHNNYFNEPEYWDWQWVYEKLLERLSALNPWCATGAEISEWWRRNSTQNMN